MQAGLIFYNLKSQEVSCAEDAETRKNAKEENLN
jgi:hypothetical protein